LFGLSVEKTAGVRWKIVRQYRRVVTSSEESGGQKPAAAWLPENPGNEATLVLRGQSERSNDVL
jgi:hypothetical protein